MARLRRLSAAAWIGGGAVVLWLAFHSAFANYDALYALVWGRELGQGQLPRYDVSLAPTPHPLANLVGLLMTPLSSHAVNGTHGNTAEDVLVGLAFVALAVLGWVVYQLGAAWFGRAAGVLAAAIVLTREPVLSYGVRAYVDIPYVALVLGALLVETRRPRAGWPVFALLGLAGLLRPEAWLFAIAYAGYLWWTGRREPAQLVRLAALALAAPVLWAIADLAVTGNALYSLTGTRATAESLGRVTGLANVPVTFPRRIGEVLREPVLFGAAVGGVLSLWRLRDRARLGVAAAVIAVVAFCLLAIAGLPILTRYVLLPASILAIFCGAGVFGWLRLARTDPWRLRWVALAVATVVLLAAYVPQQVGRLTSLESSLATQLRIRDDLRALTVSSDGRPAAISAACGPIAVPNHRPVPLLALWLDVPPSDVVSAETQRTTHGTYIAPANTSVAKNFMLDPHDPTQFLPSAPHGFRLDARNRSWLVYTRCTG